uniref:Alpha-1,3/1,6-mannosyltransferase ALG2 n=1 Tax=Wollemia nobilis TaxID=56998 RepID=A0A0C9RUF8_9CONI
MASSSRSTRKLKIAICHPDLGIGGAERLIVDAAVELASRGHEVHVFTAHHDRGRCFEETVDGLFPVTVYGNFLPRHIFYRFHAICAYLRCIYVAICMVLRWPSFDVVLADQVSVVIPVLKLKSSKVIFYCHFPDLLLAQHTTKLRRFYRRPLDMLEEVSTGMADLILVNSMYTASVFAETFKSLHARGINPSVLYPAVNVDQFSQPCAYKRKFLSINRFERKKNIELAILAFAKVMSKEPYEGILEQVPNGEMDVLLVIAGGFDKRLKENTEYLEELKDLTAKEGVSDKVVFIPSCSTAERDALLSECLCVLYTPKNEHFGIVPLEAMAAQKPVIACNSGGPLESIKHNITGFLCEPTPQNFSSAMLMLLKDADMAKRMGKEARDHVEKTFSRQVLGKTLNRIIFSVLESTN